MNLLYATGGFAYGNVILNTAWTAQESLGPTVFPAIAAQNNLSKTLPGWTAGSEISPPVSWESAAANTTLSLSAWTIKLGINYHFL